MEIAYPKGRRGCNRDDLNTLIINNLYLDNLF